MLQEKQQDIHRQIEMKRIKCEREIQLAKIALNASQADASKQFKMEKVLAQIPQFDENNVELFFDGFEAVAELKAWKECFFVELIQRS